MIKFSGRSAIVFSQKTVKFNGGELHPVLEWSSNSSAYLIEINALITSADDLMELLLVKDAVDRLNQGMRLETRLVMPYIPYARQDRVANTGEALGIKVLCDLINNMNFNRVVVHDAHSPVALALLNNVTEIPQEQGLRGIYTFNAQDIILAPDAGAMKKAAKFAELNDLPLLHATKSRSTVDGMLTNFSINFDNLVSLDFVKQRVSRGGRIVVVDDICDGGGTFLGIGKLLAELGILKYQEVGHGEDSHLNYKGAILLVTHGIFAKNATAKLVRYFEEVKAVNTWTKGD